MRHPPRSVLLAVASAAALLGTALAPVVSASGATSARTVRYTVGGQWDTGSQASVTVTNDRTAPIGRSLGCGLPDGRRIMRGWSARWSRSGTAVTAANESWKGAPATGAAAGFPRSWPGTNAVPTASTLNGTTGFGLVPPPTPTGPPATGTAPAPRVLGPRLVGAAGAPRGLLGVNRFGGEFMRVRGRGIWDGLVDDTAIGAAISLPPATAAPSTPVPVRAAGTLPSPRSRPRCR
ncbi:cellulose binding domain-containing protein [Streptomyces sp. NPDC001414]